MERDFKEEIQREMYTNKWIGREMEIKTRVREGEGAM